MVSRIGTWLLYYGIVSLVLIVGWDQPLRNIFGPGADSPGSAAIPAATTATPAPPTPASSPSPTDDNHAEASQANRRAVQFSTPAP